MSKGHIAPNYIFNLQVKKVGPPGLPERTAAGLLLCAASVARDKLLAHAGIESQDLRVPFPRHSQLALH